MNAQRRVRGTAILQRAAEIQQALFDFAHRKAALEITRSDASFLSDFLLRAMAQDDVRELLYEAIPGRPPATLADWVAVDCALRRREHPKERVKVMHAAVGQRWRIPVSRVKAYEREYQSLARELLAKLPHDGLRTVVDERRAMRR